MNLKLDLDQLKDIAERALSTYVQSVAGLIAASGMTDLSMSNVKAIAVSAAPAALSIIKSYFASVLPMGDKSASVLPMAKPSGSEYKAE
jgi:hypothetical protein